MGKKVEMIGRRFGRVIVLSEDKRDSQGIIYEPYKAPNFGNLIAILDVLGLKEVTIKWK